MPFGVFLWHCFFFSACSTSLLGFIFFIWRNILVRYQILKIKFGTRRYGTAFYEWSLWLLCQAKEIRSWVLKFALQYK